MAGRGSFIESFPLFGYDLDDYDSLFAEKLELLLAIRDGNPVTWVGRHRPPLQGAGIWPRPMQNSLPIWIAVGGTPQSVVRAASMGLPLTIAINTHAFVGPTRADADSAFAASYLGMMNRIGPERGWPPSGQAGYEALASPSGDLAVGDRRGPDKSTER